MWYVLSVRSVLCLLPGLPQQHCCPLQMGETPLIRCAHNGHLKCVEHLVEKGADVNAIDLVRLPDFKSSSVDYICRL